MDFGLYLPCYYPETDTKSAGDLYHEAIEQAQLAEELGFASVSIPEHHFIDYITVPNPLALATAVGLSTSKVRVVTAVLVLPFYDMRRLAGEIAMVDQMIDGRLELGVARGAFAFESSRFDLTPALAKASFYESLELLELFLSEEEITFKGERYNIDKPTTSMPRPQQQDPCPPIWIASVSEEGMRWALERGYSVQSTPLRKPWEASLDLARTFETLRDELVPDGGAKHDMLRNMWVSTDQADLDVKAEMLLDNDRRFKNLFETPGTVKNGRSQLIETDATIQGVRENVIFGDPDTVTEKVVKHAEIGLNGIQLNMCFGASHEDIMKSMRLFAKEVMPAVAEAVPA